MHACTGAGVGGPSLQEHAAQPGSLGLGVVSGIPILSVSRAGHGTGHWALCGERRMRGDLRGTARSDSPALGAQQPPHNGLLPAGLSESPGMFT